MRHILASSIILSAIVAAFVLEAAHGAIADDSRLIALGALPDTAQLGGEYWRWMTFGFLHWDLLHLALNSLLLLLAGPVAERRSGSLCLLLTFMTASVLSGAGISVRHMLWPAAGASVGASGGMFGLLGLALVLVYRFPPNRTVIRTGMVMMTLSAFGYSLLPGISMVGHVVGFLVGVLAGYFVRRRIYS